MTTQNAMKRPMPWTDKEEGDSSSDVSRSCDSVSQGKDGPGKSESRCGSDSDKLSQKFCEAIKQSMAIEPESSSSKENNLKNKKIRFVNEHEEKDEEELKCESRFSNLDENLLYEVLKHADARTLAVAACVSKQWYRTALDERLWEMIYMRQCATNCCTNQLTSVVRALGGFRRLHGRYLSKTHSSSSAARVGNMPPLSVVPQAAKGSKRWGKDEVNLSLSLMSIRFYEKMRSK